MGEAKDVELSIVINHPPSSTAFVFCSRFPGES